MRPDHITFTGVDAHTDLGRLADLSAIYPCEWGVLFSAKRQGQETRYPSQEVIDRILETEGVQFAAHLCGNIATRVMNGASFQ